MKNIYKDIARINIKYHIENWDLMKSKFSLFHTSLFSSRFEPINSSINNIFVNTYINNRKTLKS